MLLTSFDRQDAQVLAAAMLVISAQVEMQAMMKTLGITYHGVADPIKLEPKLGMEFR